jgi:hypothetical protein
MMTEFEVRRRVRDIRSSGEPPSRKARMLLRIGRVLKAQLRTLNRSARVSKQTQDKNAQATFSRMAQTSQSLREEVRHEADELLKPREKAGVL